MTGGHAVVLPLECCFACPDFSVQLQGADLSRGLLTAQLQRLPWELFSFMIVGWHISNLMASLKAEVTSLADLSPQVLPYSVTLYRSIFPVLICSKLDIGKETGLRCFFALGLAHHLAGSYSCRHEGGRGVCWRH